MDLATVAGTEDWKVMVAGTEQPLHMGGDSMAPKVELAELDEFPISY